MFASLLGCACIVDGDINCKHQCSALLQQHHIDVRQHQQMECRCPPLGSATISMHLLPPPCVTASSVMPDGQADLPL